jgi:hypothetical protein
MMRSLARVTRRCRTLTSAVKHSSQSCPARYILYNSVQRSLIRSGSRGQVDMRQFVGLRKLIDVRFLLR